VTRGVAWARHRWYVVAGMVVVLCVQAWLAKGVVDGAHDRQRRTAEAAASRARIEASASEAKDLAAEVKAQTDILLSVTGPEAQERQAAGTRLILFSNSVENDCRGRRQQARLPAPDVAPAPPPGLNPAQLAAYFDGYSCVHQTDPSVYPGVEGQPAKGP